MDQRYRISWYERRAIEVPRHPIIKWLFGPKYISPYMHHSMIIDGITIDKEKIRILPEEVTHAHLCLMAIEPADVWDSWTEEE